MLTASTAEELQKALAEAAGIDNTVVIYIKVDAKGRFGGSGAWWDVPVSEISELDSTQPARTEYEAEVAEPEALPVTAVSRSTTAADAAARVADGGRRRAHRADHRRPAPDRLRRRHLRGARPRHRDGP